MLIHSEFRIAREVEGQAGHRSAARLAMAEAGVQFQRGLDQLALLPNTADRQRQELELRSALGTALMAAKGLAAQEAGLAYARARQRFLRDRTNAAKASPILSGLSS
jgi:hypothetical protein